MTVNDLWRMIVIYIYIYIWSCEYKDDRVFDKWWITHSGGYVIVPTYEFVFNFGSYMYIYVYMYMCQCMMLWRINDW